MNAAEFFPLYVTESDKPDYDLLPGTGPTGPVYEVYLKLESNGENPLFSFENKGGHNCHRRDGGKDHFSGGEPHYGIKFIIHNEDDWHFDVDKGPIRFLDPDVLQYYSLQHENHRAFVLQVRRSNNAANPFHAFNLYLIEDTDKGRKGRRVDPDVENPPIGKDPM